MKGTLGDDTGSDARKGSKWRIMKRMRTWRKCWKEAPPPRLKKKKKKSPADEDDDGNAADAAAPAT